MKKEHCTDQYLESVYKESLALTSSATSKYHKEIETYLRGKLSQNLDYHTGKIIGWPGTYPTIESMKAYAMAMVYHANNTGTHTLMETEEGFIGTADIERELVYTIAKWLGVESKEDIDGYVCSGGTSGNIMGMLLGRGVKPGKTTILTPCITHYSIAKGAFVTGIEAVKYLGVDQAGSVLLNDLEENIKSIIDSDSSGNIILMCNAGSTFMGAVDSMPHVSKIIGDYKERYPNFNFHVHVDAASGGFLAPFSDEIGAIGFENEHIDSLVTDLHKTGMTPYGGGIFLAKKGLMSRTASNSPYVKGGDFQLEGSRAGAMAVSGLASIKSFGYEGYSQIAKRILEMTKKIGYDISQMGYETYPITTNVITIKDPGLKAIKHLNSKEYHGLNQSTFPSDLSDVTKPFNQSVFQIIVMKHFLDRPRLVNELLSEMNNFSENPY